MKCDKLTDQHDMSVPGGIWTCGSYGYKHKKKNNNDNKNV